MSYDIKIIVVDTEWTCQEKPEDWKNGEFSEIIEIGACILHTSSGDIGRKKNYIVRPYNSAVSEYCESLTGITQSLVKSRGIMFKHAIDKMAKELGTKNKAWAGWGDERSGFITECEKKNSEYKFSPQYIDAQLLFSCRHGIKKTNLEDAVKFYGLEFEGRPHSGLSDAINTARILWKILKC